MTLAEAQRRLDIARENYRIHTDGKRWQIFYGALQEYVELLHEEGNFHRH